MDDWLLDSEGVEELTQMLGYAEGIDPSIGLDLVPEPSAPVAISPSAATSSIAPAHLVPPKPGVFK